MGDKEKILSKLNIKDYRNELELMLEGKMFDEEAKNLILSIFYKLDNFYKDYTIVKKHCESKADFIEKYINTIKTECTKISILSPQECGKNKCIVDIKSGEISCIASENLLLYAIFELNEKFQQVQKYGLKDFANICVNYVLVKGNTINSTEPIRDFNGWSWNSQISNAENISYNLIFQNMLMLFGYDFVQSSINKANIIDVIKDEIDRKSLGEYGYEFLNTLLDICINLYNNASMQNHKRCLKCKKSITSKVDLLKNRKEYINNKSKINEDIIKKIQKIDIVLNDVNLTKKVYEKNIKAGKIKCYSVGDFIDRLEKERTKLLNKVDNNNKLLSPKEYLKNYEEYKSTLSLYSSINEENNKVNIQNKLIKLQKAFLKCKKLIISRENNKKNLYNLVTELRYYYNIPCNTNKKIMSQDRISSDLEEISYELVKKVIENKVVDTGFKTLKLNNDILGYVFRTRMLKLDAISIRISYIKNNEIEVEYYDKNILEYKEKYQIPPEEKNANKKDRKIKIFKIGG